MSTKTCQIKNEKIVLKVFAIMGNIQRMCTSQKDVYL